jgi:hypothetical protein
MQVQGMLNGRGIDHPEMDRIALRVGWAVGGTTP